MIEEALNRLAAALERNNELTEKMLSGTALAAPTSKPGRRRKADPLPKEDESAPDCPSEEDASGTVTLTYDPEVAKGILNDDEIDATDDVVTVDAPAPEAVITPDTEPVEVAVPDAPSVTHDDIRAIVRTKRAAAAKEADFITAFGALRSKWGVKVITEIPEDKLPAFKSELESL